MRKGFLLSRHEREPEARNAPSKAKADVDKTAAPMCMRREPERRFSAAEHEVFCCIASPLALFAGEAPVLHLCRDQERELWRLVMSIAAARAGVAMLPLPSPVNMILDNGREPSRLVVERICSMRRLVLPRLFFVIWRRARYF